jgi:hypothetical protein
MPEEGDLPRRLWRITQHPQLALIRARPRAGMGVFAGLAGRWAVLRRRGLSAPASS